MQNCDASIMQDIHYNHSGGVAILGTAEERADCIGKGCWEAAVGDKPGRGNHRPRRTSGGVSGEGSSVCQSFVSATSRSSAFCIFMIAAEGTEFIENIISRRGASKEISRLLILRRGAIALLLRRIGILLRRVPGRARVRWIVGHGLTRKRGERGGRRRDQVKPEKKGSM